MIGNGGTEHGAARGYVTAYDAETGEQVWRFYIVPGNPADGFENAAMEMAAKTWTGEWWKFGGGGNAWHGFTYDPELDRSTSAPATARRGTGRSGARVAATTCSSASIVALNPDTGEYIWHYQTTPGETWDYNSNMDIVLADLPIDGRHGQGDAARPQERVLLRDRPPHREAALGRSVRGGDLGVEASISTTGRPVEVPGPATRADPRPWRPVRRSPQLARDVVQPRHRPRVYIPTIHRAMQMSDARHRPRRLAVAGLEGRRPR